MSADTLPDVQCAYCRRPTPPERRLSSIWTWPGKGEVCACIGCSLTDSELAVYVAPALKREPAPFVQIVKRVARLHPLVRFTDSEVRKALVELESCNEAELVAGRGWAK